MEPQSPAAEGNQTTGAVNCCFRFPVPDQELIWWGPKPCSYFCAPSPEGSIEQAVTQTRLTCSTVFLAEDGNLCDAAPKFIPTAWGSSCLRKTGLWSEVSRAVLWVTVPHLPRHSSAPPFFWENCFGGEGKSFQSKRKEALLSHQTQILTFLAC